MGLTALLELLSPGLSAGLLLLTALIGYFLGTCNGAILISRFFLHDDVRKHGSGNGGLTNFQRTYKGTKKGNALTLLVILTDMLKMVLGVAIAQLLFSLALPEGSEIPRFVQYWAGASVVLGHIFPCTLGFQGGKGILSGGTIALIVDWRVAVIAWGLFLAAVLLTRWVSLGSVLAAGSFGVTSSLVFPCPSIILLSWLVGGLIVWKHRANIRRLLRGEESKLSFHKNKEETT